MTPQDTTLLAELHQMVREIHERVVPQRTPQPTHFGNGNGADESDDLDVDTPMVGPCQTQECGHNPASVYLALQGLSKKVQDALVTARYHSREAIAAATDQTLLNVPGGLGGYRGLGEIKRWLEQPSA